MQRTVVTLACAFAFIGGSALAQQQGSSSGSLTERAKQGAQTLGEKTKEAAEKAKDKIEETAHDAKTGSDHAAQSGGQANGPEQMQRQADADYKSAKAQCEPIQQKLQRTLCEKQATAAHANAEVEIEKAKIAAEGGSTSSMGAGKSPR